MALEKIQGLDWMVKMQNNEAILSSAADEDAVRYIPLADSVS